MPGVTAGARAKPGLKARLVGAAYALGWSAVCRSPESWAAAAFGFFADLAWRRQGPAIRVLEGNLRRVLGPAATGQELRAASRASMRSYARYWLETFRLPVLPAERLVGGMVETGQVDAMLGILAGGRGVVVPLPHMGNWDQAGAWVIGRGAGSFTTVMERLEPESLYKRFLALRENLGMEVLPASGGPSPFGVLAQRLRAGKLVALPCDREVTGGGIEVDFFGEKALMMGGPAALAVQTGAALMPATLWYEGDRWGVRIHEEVPVPEVGDRRQKAAAMTQEIARVFEQGIREHPADWHMLQRVFVADLDPQRLASARGRVAARERAAPKNGAGPGPGQAANDRPSPTAPGPAAPGPAANGQAANGRPSSTDTVAGGA
ncbi:MAG TPA: phosphatidylinositol mannoside acyltransferase [Streptosporangiaceae bacterium]|nr:phosphatidylinositol mannoside acyltransferase [Streptosporangiaceae bacterium]